MATTKDDIRRWLEEGKEQGAAYMIVACDTFSYDDYPIHVLPEEDLKEKLAAHDGVNMQKVMEVYDLSIDIDEQIKERRSWRSIRELQAKDEAQPKEDPMIEKLVQAVAALPELMAFPSRWDSLVINKRKPHTYRAFTMLDDDTRLCLHRFDPCSEEEAFLHPHPWPGAFLVLEGEYRMRVGFSSDLESAPQIIMDTILADGSVYSMRNPRGWHSVQPITTCWSIMVNGKPWAKEMTHKAAPTTKGKDLDKMTPVEMSKHLAKFQLAEMILPKSLMERLPE